MRALCYNYIYTARATLKKTSDKIINLIFHHYAFGGSLDLVQIYLPADLAKGHEGGPCVSKYLIYSCVLVQEMSEHA
jgi:hypothetical protein